MTKDEATTILTGLVAAFPSVRMTENTPDVWRTFLLPLDFEAADRAVAQCILNLEFFPAIATFSEFYSAERNKLRAQAPQLPSGDQGSTEIPEWVHVWWWNLRRTETARRAANTTSRAKPADRTPIRMRGFPQEEDPGPNPLSPTEYEKVREAWVAAGSPQAISVTPKIATPC